MQEKNLPSPNIGGRGYHLRRVAAIAISQLQASANAYPNGKHPNAAKLKAFFDKASTEVAKLV